MDEKCPKCGKNSIISVANQDGVEFFSCHTKKCLYYAHMLVDVGIDDDHTFIPLETMFNGMNQVLKDEEPKEDENG